MFFPTIAKVRRKLDSLMDDLIVIADQAAQRVDDIESAVAVLNVRKAEAYADKTEALRFRSSILSRKN
jgi:hypothetical protein